MNPDTNRFEPLEVKALEEDRNRIAELRHYAATALLRRDGSPVPKHWTVLSVDELVEIKGYTFRVKYIGETSILFEPVRPEDALKEAPDGQDEKG